MTKTAMNTKEEETSHIKPFSSEPPVQRWCWFTSTKRDELELVQESEVNRIKNIQTSEGSGLRKELTQRPWVQSSAVQKDKNKP